MNLTIYDVCQSVIVNNNIPYERTAYEVAGYDALLKKAIEQVKQVKLKIKVMI